jgi:hypothetical protein
MTIELRARGSPGARISPKALISGRGRGQKYSDRSAGLCLALDLDIIQVTSSALISSHDHFVFPLACQIPVRDMEALHPR